MTPTRGQLLRFTPAIVIVLFLISAPFSLGSVITSLVNKILIFALLAMALDIAFGYTGLWSFGHAAIFGVASYTVALIIRYAGITSFWVLAPAGLIMATITAAVFGLIALRASGLYFLLITFALGQMVYGSVVAWNEWTNGHDGLSGIPYPDIGLSLSRTDFYYFTLVVFVICVFILYRIIKSPFGYSLQGIREGETRMRALGYNTWLHKYIAFIISGFFAGIAGVLYVHFNGLIVPENVGFAASGLALIMVIIGGSGTLWGAFIGSGVILVLNFYVSSITTNRWPTVLGVVFVAAVMLARGGIFPALNNLWTKVSNYGRVGG